MKDLLIVEDDPTLGEGIRLALQAPELRPQLCRSLADAGELLSRRSFDLLILDINLPDGNGLDLLRALRRESEVPVILLTANDLETDIVAGLELGADDYIAKPFRPLELVSRVKNVLRRRGRSRSVLRAGDLLVDTVKGTVTRDGQEIILSALEYRLFLVFLNRQGEVLTRNRLLEEIWDIAGDYVNDNTLTVYIKRLRDKIEKDPAHPEIIETVRGRGYKVG